MSTDDWETVRRLRRAALEQLEAFAGALGRVDWMDADQVALTEKRGRVIAAFNTTIEKAAAHVEPDEDDIDARAEADARDRAYRDELVRRIKRLTDAGRAVAGGDDGPGTARTDEPGELGMGGDPVAGVMGAERSASADE